MKTELYKLPGLLTKENGNRPREIAIANVRGSAWLSFRDGPAFTSVVTKLSRGLFFKQMVWNQTFTDSRK